MIVGMPEKFNAVEVLEKFEFGSEEAAHDELLDKCFCKIPPIRNFLKNNHDIIVGAKGSGKSAVLKLLKDGKIQFDNTEKNKILYMMIDEPMEYETLRAHLYEKIKSKINKTDIKYRYWWELYILYRMCVELQKQTFININSLKKEISQVVDLFEQTSKNNKILNFLITSKKTVGFKLDMTNPALPSPDFYFSAEPNLPQEDKSPEQITIKIDDLKKSIDELLTKQGYRIYVFVDNLDDFVAGDKYYIQKDVLHGILHCCRNYRMLKSIYLKISIRTDLFNKLDFNLVGGFDKVEPHVINLRWEPADIRGFIARRLIPNIMKIFDMKQFGIKLEGDLDIKPKKKNKFWALVLFFWKKIKYDEFDARQITLEDQAIRSIILTFFPLETKHYQMDGKIAGNLNLFNYLETHFCFATKQTTPRTILKYLNCLKTITLQYYEENPDKCELKVTPDFHYPLFKRDCLMRAYHALQEYIVQCIQSWIMEKRWQRQVAHFFANKGKTHKFTFEKLGNLLEENDDRNMRSLLAYMTHLGIISCDDSTIKVERRIYELPVLLRFIWALPTAE